MCRAKQTALLPWVPTTLSLPHFLSSAGTPVNFADSTCGSWGLYLTIFQNETETPGDRFERAEGICGFVDPTEQ